MGSPGAFAQLCQNDSFFDDVDCEMLDSGQAKPVIEILNNSKESQDMFADSDTEADDTIQVDQKTQNCVESQKSQSTPSSLPLSFVDVRQRALEELRNRPVIAPNTKVEDVKETESSRLEKDEVDRGPFFGLPSRVRELYVDVKGVKSLFPWQVRCLTSPAVQNKSNLLYSLPY